MKFCHNCSTELKDGETEESCPTCLLHYKGKCEHLRTALAEKEEELREAVSVLESIEEYWNGNPESAVDAAEEARDCAAEWLDAHPELQQREDG